MQTIKFVIDTENFTDQNIASMQYLLLMAQSFEVIFDLENNEVMGPDLSSLTKILLQMQGVHGLELDQLQFKKSNPLRLKESIGRITDIQRPNKLTIHVKQKIIRSNLVKALTEFVDELCANNQRLDRFIFNPTNTDRDKM